MSATLTSAVRTQEAHNRVFPPSPNGHGAPSRNGSNGAAPPSATDANGRDAGGRFGKGNAGGPGNPFARRIAEFRKALLAAVTEQDITDIAKKLIAEAKEGDVPAARLVFAYALGKPAPVANPDTLDLEEWRLHEQQPLAKEVPARAMNRLPVADACVLSRINAIIKGGEFEKGLLSVVNGTANGRNRKGKNQRKRNWR